MTSIHEELKAKAERAAAWGEFNPSPYAAPQPGATPMSPTSPGSSMDNRFVDLDAAMEELKAARASGDDMKIRDALEKLKGSQALIQEQGV